MSQARFEPATPASERPQAHAIDHAATGVCVCQWCHTSHHLTYKPCVSFSYLHLLYTLHRPCSSGPLFMADLSTGRYGFHIRAFHFSFMVDKVTQGEVFLPRLQFSPVSTIPPLLHTHPSIYHPRCIMFFSQYLSFPLSVPFHHCTTPIHPSTTHVV